MIEIINKRLSELVPSDHTSLFEAARYSLLGEGKRFRPQIVLATAQGFGASLEAALDPACAIEMVHTYSLIHDDLPCMDNDDLRRGKPTLHKQYTEAIALLAGDYLLTRAFETLASAPGLSPEQKVELIQILSKRAGSGGMIGGQMLDIESDGKSISRQALLTLHQKKTGDLLAACFEFGVCIAGKTSPLLQSVAQEVGLAYQLQDDLFDADSNEVKPNAVSIFGSQQTKIMIQQLQTSILHKLKKLPEEIAPLIKNVLNRKF